MGERVRRMSAREVESLLRKNGFELISQRSSHRKWRSASAGLIVIVPEHRGKTLPIGTLSHILKSAEIPEDEWRG